MVEFLELGGVVEFFRKNASGRNFT